METAIESPDSPLTKWMRRKEISQAQLAAIAEVDRTDVCRMANASVRGNSKLRRFLGNLDADMLSAHEAFYRAQVDDVREKVMAG